MYKPFREIPRYPDRNRVYPTGRERPSWVIRRVYGNRDEKKPPRRERSDPPTADRSASGMNGARSSERTPGVVLIEPRPAPGGAARGERPARRAERPASGRCTRRRFRRGALSVEKRIMQGISGRGHPISGTRETWVVRFALSPLPTVGASPGDPRSAERRGRENFAERRTAICLPADSPATGHHSLATRRPTVDHSLVAGGARRQWLQTCVPVDRQPKCLHSRCVSLLVMA